MRIYRVYKLSYLNPSLVLELDHFESFSKMLRVKDGKDFFPLIINLGSYPTLLL